MAAPEVYHLTNVHSPFDVRIFYKQAQTLARAGYAVTVVGPGPEEWGGERDGVRVQTVPVARGVGQRILNLWRLLRVGLGADAACFHFHDPELLPVGAVLKLCGRRVIYDVHEHFPLVAMVRPWVPERLRRPLRGWLIGGNVRLPAILLRPWSEWLRSRESALPAVPLR